MDSLSTPETSTAAAITTQPFRLNRRELFLIVAFWTFMAVLSFANRCAMH